MDYDVMEQKGIVLLIISIFIIILFVVCYADMTSPTLELDNVHAKKYILTTKYSYSGEVKKDRYIECSYNITQNKALDSINVNLKLFDKERNLIDESKSAVEDTRILDYTYTHWVTKEIFKKVDSMEITFYGQDEDEILYTCTVKVLKGNNQLNEVDDTPEKHSKNDSRSYPNEDMYYVEEDDDYFWGHDEFGHRVKFPKNAYVPKLGE